MNKEEFFDKITHIVDDARSPDQSRKWSDEFFETLQIEYEDVIGFWSEQFQIADRERNELKLQLAQSKGLMSEYKQSCRFLRLIAEKYEPEEVEKYYETSE